jgi:hypothetical protein
LVFHALFGGQGPVQHQLQEVSIHIDHLLRQGRIAGHEDGVLRPARLVGVVVGRQQHLIIAVRRFLMNLNRFDLAAKA